MTRFIFTGSRHWTDEKPVERLLLALMGKYPQMTVVHGDARGLDTLVGKIATELGLRVEAWPAKWGTEGRAAGPLRNQRMVDQGARATWAFPVDGSVGTYDCMNRADKAGIPVYVYNGSRGQFEPWSPKGKE